MRSLTLLTLLTTLVVSLPVRAQAEDPRSILEKAIKAHGGADALSNSAAVYMKLQMKIDSIPGNAAMEGEAWEQSNGSQKSILNITVADTKISVAHVVHNGKGWRQMNGEIQDLTPAELSEIKQSTYADRVQSLVPLLKDKRFTLTALGSSKVDDVAVSGVKVAMPGEPDILLYFDEKTSLLKKVEYKRNMAAGEKDILMTTILDDYRAVDQAAIDEKTLKALSVGSDGPALLAYLRTQMRGEADRKAIKELIGQLGDETFEVREKATTQLITLGPIAMPFLREATKNKDAEVARRAILCLEKIGDATRPEGVLGAALRLVSVRKPAGAAELLLALAPSVTEPALKNELHWALASVAMRDGKPDKIVEQALDDKDPDRRAAAVAALGKDGGALAKQPGRRVMLDGLKRPMKMTSYRDGKKEGEIEITEILIVNQFDESIFARPK